MHGPALRILVRNRHQQLLFSGGAGLRLAIRDSWLAINGFATCGYGRSSGHADRIAIATKPVSPEDLDVYAKPSEVAALEYNQERSSNESDHFGTPELSDGNIFALVTLTTISR